MKLLQRYICLAICFGCLFYQGSVCASEIEGIAASEELKLDLYYRVDCPYCQKVIRYFYQNGVAIGLKDIRRENAFKEELIGVTGRAQVPCLSINGMMLHESGDIIQWFEDNITKSL